MNARLPSQAQILSLLLLGFHAAEFSPAVRGPCALEVVMHYAVRVYAPIFYRADVLYGIPEKKFACWRSLGYYTTQISDDGVTLS